MQNDVTMQELIDGIAHFQMQVFPQHRERFEQLATGQAPRWLVIACSDSRLMPSMLLQTNPGDLFECRNAGNIVPPHGDAAGGVSATIEYAVQVLKVKHIIVCGHSDCGAMKAVLHPQSVGTLRAVAKWISYAERARAVALEEAAGRSDDELLASITDENVLAQLDNLRTHPFVAAKLRTNAIALHGWVFDIRHGTFKSWNDEERVWEPIGVSMLTHPKTAAADAVKHA